VPVPRFGVLPFGGVCRGVLDSGGTPLGVVFRCSYRSGASFGGVPVCCRCSRSVVINSVVFLLQSVSIRGGPRFGVVCFCRSSRVGGSSDLVVFLCSSRSGGTSIWWCLCAVFDSGVIDVGGCSCGSVSIRVGCLHSVRVSCFGRFSIREVSSIQWLVLCSSRFGFFFFLFFGVSHSGLFCAVLDSGVLQRCGVRFAVLDFGGPQFR
jgi:hypothetical protein